MTLEEFVFNIPLYHKIDVTNGYDDIIQQLNGVNNLSSSVTIDGYNPLNKKDTTYRLIFGLGNLRESSGIGSGFSTRFYYYSNLIKEQGVKTIVFECQRYGNTITIAVFHDYDKAIIMKVGQYPSVADIHIGQVKQYDKVLEKSIMKEFTKAIGLAANGIGIGSFVYLRRIFENLIFDAYNEAKNDNAIDEKQFNSIVILCFIIGIKDEIFKNSS